MAAIAEWLGTYLRSERIRSVVDIGCGSWRQCQVEWDRTRYVGLHADAQVVESLRTHHPTATAHFLTASEYREPFASSDLVLFQDTFPFEQPAEAFRLLRKLRACRRVLVIETDRTGACHSLARSPFFLSTQGMECPSGFSAEQWLASRDGFAGPIPDWQSVTLDKTTSSYYLELANERIEPYPCGRFHGRGIVIAGGGPKYFTCAWVCIRMLRRLGCTLPIELWHLGREEMSDTMSSLVRDYNVTTVDAFERAPRVRLAGWPLKPFAILNSCFREVLFLDADNVPTMDPEYLFDSTPYQQMGAIFWPDRGRLAITRSMWEVAGLDYRDEPEFESGQIVVDKARCWRSLCLTMWINEFSDFFYRHVYGDKDTFRIAWHKAGQRYAMPPFKVYPLPHIMCQHDFQGRRIFQHRCGPKWSLPGANLEVTGFVGESVCLDFLQELASRWDIAKLRRFQLAAADPALDATARKLCRYEWRMISGATEKRMAFGLDGLILKGSTSDHRTWDLLHGDECEPQLHIVGETATTHLMRPTQDGWHSVHPTEGSSVRLNAVLDAPQ